jgi:predicted TIM-barrel fold metal-dependent hydrolase
VTDLDVEGAVRLLEPKRADPREPVTFLPEPEPREPTLTIISVDDHVIEAPDMFHGRIPSRFSDVGPRVVELADGSQVWKVEDSINRDIGLSAVVGRPRGDYLLQASRFEHMRPGCYQPAARVHDMDINGIGASLNFPSALAGFAGTRFANLKDSDLGLACVRAWNDWILEEWVAPYPTRFIPSQLPWLNDVEVAAAEIRKNASRGFTSVSFSEAPHKAGRPSLHSGYWDPFIAACEETETVICLHTGSSSSIHTTAADAPAGVIPILFPISGMFAAVDWLYARVPVRFPNVKIALSEGGIGWVPGLIDRLIHSARHREYLDDDWGQGARLTAIDLLRRNFWFCALDDPIGFEVADHIGVSHIMIESDYPHEDSTWPDTQTLFAEQLAPLSAEARDLVTHRNALNLYRHTL